MASNVSLTLNGYSFDPVPASISISKNIVRTGAGSPISIQYTATLEGVLFTDQCAGGNIASVMNQKALLCQNIGSCDSCVYMDLECGSTVLFRGYVKINSVEFRPSPDNWVITIPYSIQISWSASEDLTPLVYLDSSGNIIVDDTQTSSSGSNCYECLVSVDENWEIAPIDNHYAFDIGVSCSGNAEAYRVTHNISAQGVDCCDPSGDLTPGWKNARTWVLDHMKCTPDIDCSGIFGSQTLSFFDLKRSKTYNIANGNFAVTETWTALGPGQPRCVEEFSVACSEGVADNLITYSINGTITGFESRNCPTDYNSITTTKIESAQTCWAWVQNHLVDRINCIAQPTGCSVNANPISKSVTFNPLNGSIAYSYSYTNRLQLIANSRSESISISNVLPAEIISTSHVIGRVSPIIERCGIIGLLTKSVSINAVLNQNCAGLGGDLCTNWGILSSPNVSGVNSLICCIETDLEANYENVFVTQNTDNFNPLTGVYTRNITWSLQNCNQALPDLC